MSKSKRKTKRAQKKTSKPLVYTALVADRSDIDDPRLGVHLAARTMEKHFGISSTDSVRLFVESVDHKYILMFAPNRGQPLGLVCKDEEVLRAVMHKLFTEISGRGYWLATGTDETKALVAGTVRSYAVATGAPFVGPQPGDEIAARIAARMATTGVSNGAH
jgi:hypothetical protein